MMRTTMQAMVALLAALAAGAAAGQSAVATECAPDNGGITLPDGFCASVFAEDVGTARHLVVDAKGDVYVMLRERRDGFGTVALRDVNGDGRADRVERFGKMAGTGISVHDGYLYRSNSTEIRRNALEGDALVPSEETQTVVSGFPEQTQHAAKSLAFDASGHLFVNVGAPSNACQKQGRTPGSPGLDPCPQLERHAGIWRLAADATGQTVRQDAERFASGIRNAVALAWNPATRDLYIVQHGRDQLGQLWPDLYTEQQNAKLPAEELLRVNDSDDFGWPYCYYDPMQGQKVLAPEYGGDGERIGRCERFEAPIVAFPGHWAPNALLFYTAEAFGERYRGGAFVAFHGSWNRAPLPQAGYKVAFVPFEQGKPTGGYTVFAHGFVGTETLRSPAAAEYRPTGLAQGPDGALYISDSRQGRIWRVVRAP